MTTRRYVIVRVDSAPALDEECFTSISDARKNIDQTKMVLEYESAPDCLQNVDVVGDHSAESALVVMSSPEWYWE